MKRREQLERSEHKLEELIVGEQQGPQTQQEEQQKRGRRAEDAAWRET